MMTTAADPLSALAAEEAPTRSLTAGDAASGKDVLSKRLDRLTEIGVNLSTFAFVGLQIPQIIRNFTQDKELMANLAWQGYVSGTMGNLLLGTYFASVGEWAAVRVQIIGAVTSYFVASQIYFAGYFPALQFWAVFVVMCVCLAMPLLYAMRVMPQSAFDVWNKSTAAVGLAAFSFSITATFVSEDVPLLVAAVSGLAVGLALLVLGKRVPAFAPVTASLGGWTATLLFMFMPLPQIYNIFVEGRSAAEAFNMSFCVLATFGNGLGATRAFVIKEQVWFVGSIWGLVVGGWLTAVAVHVVNPEQCPLMALIPYTAFLLFYFVFVATVNGKAKQEGLWRQVSFVFGIKRPTEARELHGGVV